MKKFGRQYLNKSLEMFSVKENVTQKWTKDNLEIKDVLRKFQAGYIDRDIKKVDEFVEELFVMADDTCILGTATGEVFLGIERVRELIKDDWEGWGDVNVDLENVHIDNENEVAWIATTCTIKYNFEDTPERYDSYLNFIKSKVEDPELTPKQKITFINWILALTYHQRLEKKREYLWPMGLSGVLLKENGKWKFTNLHFSIPKANFPDERFENSEEYIESYNNQNEILDKHLNNHMTTELKALLKNLEREFAEKEDITKELISKYFVTENTPYIIGSDNERFEGVDNIKEFFTENRGFTLSLDLEHAIASKSREITWVTVCGTLKQSLTEDELTVQALEELESLFQSKLTSKEKLFATHRSIAYVLKESATGSEYTCPIRLTAVISNSKEGIAFQSIHFSFPFNWILEGKIEGV